MSERIIQITSNDLVSVQEAARLLNRPRVTIYRWVIVGKILSLKLGGTVYIPRTEVERLTSSDRI